jgi:hypothetical protein
MSPDSTWWSRSDVSDVHAFARREDDVRLFTALDRSSDDDGACARVDRARGGMEVDRERCVRNRGGDDAGVTTRDGWMDASCASLGLRGSTTGRGGRGEGARRRDRHARVDRSRWNRSVRARVSSGSRLGRRERVDANGWTRTWAWLGSSRARGWTMMMMVVGGGD